MNKLISIPRRPFFYYWVKVRCSVLLTLFFSFLGRKDFLFLLFIKLQSLQLLEAHPAMATLATDV